MRPETSLPQNGYWQLLWRFTKLTTGVGVFVFVIAQYAYGMSLHNPWQSTQYEKAKAGSAYLLSWNIRNGTNDARTGAINGSGAAAINVTSTVVVNVSTVAKNVSTVATNVSHTVTTNGSTIATNVSRTVTTNGSTIATNVSTVVTNVSPIVTTHVPRVIVTNSSSTVATNVSGVATNSSSTVATTVSRAIETGEHSALPSTGSSETRLVACPLIPANLSGPIAVSMIPHNWTDIIEENKDVEPGGLWRPRDCIARHHVAIVVPYRDRESHLKVFLRHMHRLLQKQQLDYGIYIVDEALPTWFNRAMLMNIGYAEASKQANYSCYIFHDVDLLPEDDRNLYSCPEQPRHMSASIDKFNYRLPYEGLFGGVSAFKTEHFKLINGFSNKFFGWGGEDDDLFERTRYHKLKLTRYSMDIARYKMIKHTEELLNKPNPQRMKLLYTGKKRFKTDGLNSLKYERLDLQKLPLYTRIYVKIEESWV